MKTTFFFFATFWETADYIEFANRGINVKWTIVKQKSVKTEQRINDLIFGRLTSSFTPKNILNRAPASFYFRFFPFFVGFFFLYKLARFFFLVFFFHPKYLISRITQPRFRCRFHIARWNSVFFYHSSYLWVKKKKAHSHKVNVKFVLNFTN